MGDFDAFQCCRGCTEGFGPLHMPCQLLDEGGGCSIMLLRYLTCSTSISQNHPFKISKQFMFCSPARFAPLLSITTLSGKPLLPIARVKKAVAAASSRCSENMKLRVFPNLLMHMGWFDWLKSPPRTNRPIKLMSQSFLILKNSRQRTITLSRAGSFV